MDNNILSWLGKKRQTTEILQTDSECECLYKCVINSNNVDGDLAEVGVYNGGTAVIINEFMSNHKNLYLFDTFEGLLDCNPDKDNFLNNGDFKNIKDIDSLKNLFNNSNVDIFKGYFPDSAPKNLSTKKFSLVHLDVDTYQSTLNSLNYFYDKINHGGYIVVHDYKNQNNHTDGVTLAVDEFLKEKNETISEIVDSQCVIIKKY